MSLESIKQIHQVEQEMRAKKAEAQVHAPKIQSDAERAGRDLLEATRKQVNEEVRRLLYLADQRATEDTEQILEEARTSCSNLLKQANERLSAAAALIVERVVDI